MAGLLSRAWLRVLAACAALLLVAFGVMVLTFGAYGLLLYAAVIVLVGVWNAWVAVAWIQSWRRRSPHPSPDSVVALGLASGFVVVAWSVLMPSLFTGGKAVLLLAYAIALGETIVVVWRSGVRGKRDLLLPFYNAAGTAFLATWALQESGGDVGPLGLLVHALTRDVATFQTLHFYPLAGFLPIFLFPPVLAKPKAFRPRAAAAAIPEYHSPAISRRRLVARGARVVSRAVGLWSIYTVVVLLVFAVPSLQAISGFHALPAPGDAAYAIDENLTFAVVLGSLTDVVAPPPNYQDLVRREVLLAARLRVDAVRFDVKTELLESPEGLAALDWAIAELRGQGFRIILSPFGRDAWAAVKPTFESLNGTIHDDAVRLAQRYHPEWLFPFFEPNGQVQINLGRAMPTSAWVGAIEATAADVKAASATTRVLVEVADGPQGPELFDALLRGSADVDAVGFDLYPGSAGDLSRIDAYDALARAVPGKEFWISEFGVETVQFGEEAQARFISSIVSGATIRWSVSGLCLWALEDGTGLGMSPYLLSGLGIVTYAGRLKPGFLAYESAIAVVSNATFSG